MSNYTNMEKMKSLQYIILLSVFSFSVKTYGFSGSDAGKTSLSGKITESATGKPLIGVNIYFPDLKTGTITGMDGTYTIENLPKTKVLLQVSYIGYKTIVEPVDLRTIAHKDFALEEAVQEMNQVVITGMSRASEIKKAPSPIALVPKAALLQNTSSNIIDAITRLPGVSEITTGAGISKPVIRGLGYNRVIVVNDGIPQQGQQWGDEHGIEIDEYSVDKVEVLKGPASLSYGSDAIAGVINMISASPPPSGTIEGNIISNYQTNNGLIGISGDVDGNIKDFNWNLRYSHKQAHDYKNKYDGYVYGSKFKENSLEGTAGLNGSWGYSRLKISAYHMMPEIVEGARDSLTGKFTKEIPLTATTVGESIVSDEEMKNYSLGIPHQDIHHYKAVIDNNFILGSGNLKTILGFQQNQRKEFGNALNPNEYGLYFLLNTFNYDVRYLFPEFAGVQMSAGINGMGQSSKNKGTEFLIPEYNLFSAGGFVIAKKAIGNADISGGIRYDGRVIHSKQLLLNGSGLPVNNDIPDAFQKFGAFDARYPSWSGSLGMTYQITKTLYSKFNLARGFRSPNIAELGANGEHEGTGRYEIGNPAMKAENSLEADFSIGISSKHITAELNLFDNRINNYIYIHKLNSVFGGDSVVDPANPIPTFTYTQGEANLSGGEMVFHIHPHPLDWLEIESSYAWVNAVQMNATDSTRHLPFTPAPKLSLEVRTDFKKLGKFMSNIYIKANIDNYFKQDKVFTAFGTETPTPGYTLLNLGAGTDFNSGNRKICSFYVSINNLTDVAYESHLSRLKYMGMNYRTGRTGVFNMGRNISFELIVPIDFRQ